MVIRFGLYLSASETGWDKPSPYSIATCNCNLSLSNSLLWLVINLVKNAAVTKVFWLSLLPATKVSNSHQLQLWELFAVLRCNFFVAGSVIMFGGYLLTFFAVQILQISGSYFGGSFGFSVFIHYSY